MQIENDTAVHDQISLADLTSCGHSNYTVQSLFTGQWAVELSNVLNNVPLDTV